jgi:hypothetical protein
MSKRFGEERLARIRDLIATIRAYAQDDLERTKELLAPYRGDHPSSMALAKELIELVSSFLSEAGERGLPPAQLLNFWVGQVPSDERPTYGKVAKLILGIHEGTEARRENIVFATAQDANRFINATMDTGAWLVRQVASKTGRTADDIYEEMTFLLAQE